MSLNKVKARVCGHVLVSGKFKHLCLELLLVGGNDGALLLNNNLSPAASRLGLKFAGIVPVTLALLHLVVPAACPQPRRAHGSSDARNTERGAQEGL